MGTVTARPRSSGGIAYLARIRIKRNGRVVREESNTLETQRAAKDWIRDRESELAKPGVIEALMNDANDATLSQAIDRYTDDSRKQIGKTKAQVLETLSGWPIGKMKCRDIKADDLVALAKTMQTGRHPSTVGNYMSHLASVFTIARPAWKMPLDPAQMQDAMIVMRRLGYISKSRERDRRPTIEEANGILRFFAQGCRRAPQSNPMHKIVVFAMFSTRRQEEITRILWSDLDRENSRILVRDMKNPGEKIGNNQWCDIPPEAMSVIDTMPEKHPEIFPFNSDTISSNFTRACKMLGIDDLHFHDLRHEGISRLFEMGKTIPQVALVSGHRSWQSLKRYAHLRQSGDKWAEWSWQDQVAAATRE